jgi:hypothetical protein
MSTPPKKGFASFLRQPMQDQVPPAPEEERDPEPVALQSPPTTRPVEPQPERVRHITSTGRVRTHSANRMLPGVTLRLSEERWERIKMLSIQERRPLQDILGDAVEAYMKGRGLPW